MKKLLFILTLAICSVCYGQKDSLSFVKIQSDYQLQIDNIQSNLSYYHKEKMAGYAFSAFSLIFIGASMVTPDENTANTLLLVGGVVSFAGLVIQIDSEKWIKRASIRITPGKLTFSF